MTTALLAVAPATITPSHTEYGSIEDLLVRAELAELAADLGRAVDAAWLAARLRSELEEELDLALVQYDLEQLCKAEAIAYLLAA